MPHPYPTLAFKIGCDNPIHYYETSQQQANQILHKKLQERYVIHHHGNVNMDNLREKPPHEPKQTTLKSTTSVLEHKDGLSDSEAPAILAVPRKEWKDLQHLSEYQRGIGAKIPIHDWIKPEIEDEEYRATIPTSSVRYQTKRQLWQCIPLVTWDQIQAREPYRRTYFPHSLDSCDKRAAIRSPIKRKYPKDDEALTPDEELINLVENDKLAPILKLPYPGYTGIIPRYDLLKNGRDGQLPRAGVSKTTTNTFHRIFPLTEYRGISGRKSGADASRSVSVLYPNHPFRSEPSRTGTWDTVLPQPIW